jgi:hypothetical protein
MKMKTAANETNPDAAFWVDFLRLSLDSGRIHQDPPG